MILQAHFIVPTMIIAQAIRTRTLSIDTNSFLQPVAITITVAPIASGIFVYALSIVTAIARPGHVSSLAVVMAEKFSTIGASAITGDTLVVLADFRAGTMAVAQALGTFTLAVYTHSFVQSVAITVTAALIAGGVFVHALSTVVSIASSGHVSVLTMVMAEKFSTIGASAIAGDALTVLADVRVGTVAIAQALGALAPTAAANPFVQLEAIGVCCARSTLRVVTHTKAIGRSNTLPSHIPKSDEIVAHIFFAIGIAAVTRDAFVVFAYFVVGAMVVV